MLIVGVDADTQLFAGSDRLLKVLPSFIVELLFNKNPEISAHLWTVPSSSSSSSCSSSFEDAAAASPTNLDVVVSRSTRQQPGVVDDGAGDILSCKVFENRKPARFLAREAADRILQGNTKGGFKILQQCKLIVSMKRAVLSGNDASACFPGIFGPSGIAIVGDSFSCSSRPMHTADAEDKAREDTSGLLLWALLWKEHKFKPY
jgi:hypothetical protein